MKTPRLAVGWILVAGMMGAVPALAAQSLPPITKSKQAATRAVEATNAHTRAMTSPAADSAAAARQGGSTPSGSQGRPQGDDSQAGAARPATQSAAGRAETSAAAFEREIYRYERAGRRDPFVSLMENGDLRPLITELRVTGIVFDESGRSSVAVLRDLGTQEQYRVRVGTSLGRMRVARIDRKSVTFTIEEFGFSRQETLELSDDPNKEKKQ
ncbi:MAG TPA: hypothetical protein VLE53_11955 [Gemmatimonadaceae bacterium]|nr:hypothetical protein [Gemmatimonadaceae bacterium]